MVKITDSLPQSFEYQGLIMDENLPHYKELLVLELTRKSCDLNHRQKLQHLLIESLNQNDLNKAFLINTFLYPNLGLSSFNLLNSSQKQTENQETSSELRETEVDLKNRKNPNSSSEMELCESEISEENKTHQDQANIQIDKNLRPKLRGSPLSPIRHLICSPGLEEKADKHKIVVLYRGSCNGSCNPNKMWSKQSHLHYIINTVNCNDHVSRLVKKQGLQFFNSSVLQNPAKWNHLIKLYKMEKI